MNNDAQLHDDWDEAVAGRDEFKDLHMVTSEDGRMTGPSLHLDQAWPDIKKLRWKAALVEHETGIRIHVITGRGTRNGVEIPNQYALSIGNSGLSGATFNDNWSLLTGVEIGANEILRRNR